MEHIELAESAVEIFIHWLRLGIESVGALIILTGVLIAISKIVIEYLNRRQLDFTEIRLSLARFLVLALEFQLAADILSTAVSPSWDQIGKLAAIAIIRTVLNYFLTREIQEVQQNNEQS